MSDELRVPDIPALRMFDPKATRGAVIRGLLRTAAVVVAFLFLASLVLGAAGHVLSSALDRPERMDRLTAGLVVSHPGLDYSGGSSRVGGWRQHSTVRLEDGDGHRQQVDLQLGVFGGLAFPRPVDDPVQELLMGAPWSRVDAERYLARLPDGVLVDGIAVLARPASLESVVAATPVGRGGGRAFYGPAFAHDSEESRERMRFPFDRPVSWPLRGGIHPFDGFFEWAEALRDEDEDGLRMMRLPPVKTIKELGRSGLVSAVHVRGLTVAEAQRMLGSKAFSSFTPSAVRFDLAPPG